MRWPTSDKVYFPISGKELKGGSVDVANWCGEEILYPIMESVHFIGFNSALHHFRREVPFFHDLVPFHLFYVDGRSKIDIDIHDCRE